MVDETSFYCPANPDRQSTEKIDIIELTYGQKRQLGENNEMSALS